MEFDPSSVDLSKVEPALRDETLRRIVIVERFIRSPSPEARRHACEQLGLGEHSLYLLARVWRSRHRAEDVTVRATKRARPSSMDPALIAIIHSETEASPTAPRTEIFERVAAAATAAGLTPPRYQTVNRHARERLAELDARATPDLGHDLVVDAIVSDLPVDDGDGGRVRPQLVTVIDGRRKELVCMTGTIGDIAAADVAAAIAGAVDAAVIALPATDEEVKEAHVARPSISLPYAVGAGWDSLSVALRRAGADLDLRPINLATCGRSATALLGTSLAGYRLRPRLVGKPAARRRAEYPGLAAAPLPEAVAFLARTASRDGPAGPSPLARLGRAALDRLAIDLAGVMEAA